MGRYLIVCDSTSDKHGYIGCANAAYATARDGTGTKTEYSTTNSSGYLRIGQYYSGSSYACYEALCQFDTSVIPDGETVTDVRVAFGFNTNNSGHDFVVQLRGPYDWGGTAAHHHADVSVAYSPRRNWLG